MKIDKSILQKYYIADILEGGEPGTSEILDFFGPSIKDILEDVEDYEELDTCNFESFLEELFEHRTGLRDDYHVTATIVKDEKGRYIEFCAFSMDAANPEERGTYSVGAQYPSDLRKMKSQGLIVREEIVLPEDVKSINIKEIEEGLSRCHYYVKNNYSSIACPWDRFTKN